MTTDRAEEVARRVLAKYERSGYGTDRPDRYTPTFDVQDVLILAREVIDRG